MDIFESWLVHAPICKHGLTSETFPENTLGAYQNAVKNKTPITISVQILTDETVVCFGDQSLARLANEDGYIKTLTFSELKDVKILKTSYGIPKLEDALKVIGGKVPVLINLIGFDLNKKLESAVYSALKQYSGEYAIMSNNPDTLIWFKNNAPEVVRGIKSSFYANTKTLGSFKTCKLKKLKYNKAAQPDFICYHAENLPNRFVNKYIHLPIIAYNVKTEEDYKQVVVNCDNVVYTGFEPKI